MKRTSLYPLHKKQGAKLIPFAGFEMPVWYTSIQKEHQAVRQHAGLFDISHMGMYEISGNKADEFLSLLSCNDIAKAIPSKSVYSMFLNEDGTILDDVMLSYYQDKWYLVVNACNHQKIHNWMLKNKPLDVEIKSLNDAYNLIAIQGPKAVEITRKVLNVAPSATQVFHVLFEGEKILIFRSGYTGEDGFELIVPSTLSDQLWNLFCNEGAVCCGLGCRDTLRIEAGLPLYGQELSEEIDPLMTRYSWVIHYNHHFIGRKALEEKKTTQSTIGLIMQDKVIPRAGYPILEGGMITSGTLSLSLDQYIAMAIVPTQFSQVGTLLHVNIRNKSYPAHVCKLPFLKNKT